MGADAPCLLVRGAGPALASYNDHVNTAKEEVRKLLERLPDEESFEDIQYQLYLLDEIRRGSEEIERGEGVGQEEAARRLLARVRRA